MRWTALGASLTLAVGLSAFAASAKAKVPLPKPRPIARNVVPKTAIAPQPPVKPVASDAATAAPALQPATRQHAALPPTARKPPPPAAMAATSSTPQADTDAVENIIGLVRNHKPADATQAAAAISDPVARKLAEWIILRSDNNGASVERYRAFIEANPSWPSQTFLRRRIEAALWDDRRDDATVMAWFENEKPLSAKGKFSLARALLARGDRANAERLIRDAWRFDSMSSDTEETALDLFGALLTPGDQKARMDSMLYGSEQEAGLRAAKRIGQVALAKARNAAYRKAANTRALLDAVPHELHGDPGYMFSRIQLLRREEKFQEAAQLMLAAPRDPNRLYNLDEWWIERRLLSRKMLDVGEHRSAYLIARDAALPARDIYKTEQEFTAGWIALRFLRDPATAAQHFARIGVGSVNPTALARAGYWQGRAAEAAGRSQDARTAYAAAARQSTSYYGQLARAKLGLPQIELNGVPSSRSRGIERLEVVRAVQLLYALDEREMAIPVLGDMGENGDPDVLQGLGELASRNGDARGMLLMGKAALNRGLPFEFYAYPVVGIPPYKPIGPEVEQSIVFAIARQESAFNPSSLWVDAGDAGCRTLRLQATWCDLRSCANEDRPGLQHPVGRRRARRADRGLPRLLHHDLRRLQCRARQREKMGRAVRRSPRSQGRRRRLGRAHPVFRNPQLRAADHGKPAGLPRAFRRRHAAADRGRPAPRRGRRGRRVIAIRSCAAREPADAPRPGP
jgi:soluble lytic murein transglycosylase